MPLLVIQSEKHSAAFRLTESTVIGRLPETDLVLQAQGVSREHARINVRGEDCIIEDLESTNGTWVNGQRLVRPYRLREGDEIRVGLMRLRFLTRSDVPREMREIKRSIRQSKHIVFRCPTCHGVLQAPRQYIGRKGKCENCNTRFIVPETSGAAVQAAVSEPGRPGPGDPRKPVAPAAKAPAAPAQKPDAPIPADEPVTTTAAGLEPVVVDAVTPAETVEPAADRDGSRDLAEAPPAVEPLADRGEARTGRHVPAVVEPDTSGADARVPADQPALVDRAADRGDDRDNSETPAAVEPQADLADSQGAAEDRSDSRGQVETPAAVEAAADASLDADASAERPDSSRDLDAPAALEAWADRADSQDFIDSDRVSSLPHDDADLHDTIIGFELESNEEHEADCCDKLDDDNAVLPAAVAADRGDHDRAADRPTLVDPAAACADESRDQHAAPAAPATVLHTAFDVDRETVETAQPTSDVTDDALRVEYWHDDRAADAAPGAPGSADHPAPVDPNDRPFADVSHDATDDTVFYAHASIDLSDALRLRTPQRHADPVDAPQGAADDRTFRDDSAVPSLLADDVHLAGLDADTAADRLTVSDLPEGDRGLSDAAHAGDDEHPAAYFQEMSAAPAALHQLPPGPASQEERAEHETGTVDEPDWWQNAVVVVEKDEPQADTPPAVAVRLAQPPARQDRQQIGWVARVRRHVALRNQQIQQQAEPQPQALTPAEPAKPLVVEQPAVETPVERQPLPQSVVLARFLNLVAGMKGSSNLIVEARPNTVESGVPYETRSGRPGSAVVREAVDAQPPQAADHVDHVDIEPTEDIPAHADDAAAAPSPADVLPLVDAALSVLVEADRHAASQSHQPDQVETTLAHAPEAAQDAAEEVRPSSDTPSQLTPTVETVAPASGAVAAADEHLASSDLVVDSTLDAALPADEPRDLPTDIAAARVAADEPAKAEVASVPAVQPDEVAPAAQDPVTEQIIDAVTPAVSDDAPVVDLTEPQAAASPAPIEEEAALKEKSPQETTGDTMPAAASSDDTVVDNAHLIDWFPEEADMIATRKNPHDAVDNSHLIEWFPEPVVSGASSAPAGQDEENSHLIEWLPAEAEKEAAHVHDQNCSVCNTSIAGEDETMVCPECGTTYHAGCWHENHGCATYGCAQVNVLLEGKQPPPHLPDADAAEAPRQTGPRRRMKVRSQPVNDGVSWEVVFSLAACAACLIGLFTFGVPNLLVTAAAGLYKMGRRRRPISGIVFGLIVLFTVAAAAAGAAASMFFYGYW